MMEIKGYCVLGSTRSVIIGHEEPEKIREKLLGRPLRITYVGVDSLVVIDPDSSAFCCVTDMRDVLRWFKCSNHGNLLLPPEIPDNRKEAEIEKRQGEYTDEMKAAVISVSLGNNKFTDDFLWKK